MKALVSIGIGKAVRFVWYGLYASLIRWSLPPVRVLLLRLAGATIGRDTVLMDVHFSNLYHYGFSRLTIGNRCFLGDEVSLDLRGGVTIEDDVTVSNRTTIVTHINVGYPNHPLQKQYPTREAKVVIKKGAYIGSVATVLAGVTIGSYSVVAAGAVVTHDVAPRIMVAGVPATQKKRIR